MDGKLLVIFSIKSVAAAVALEKEIDLSSHLAKLFLCRVHQAFYFSLETGPTIKCEFTSNLFMQLPRCACVLVQRTRKLFNQTKSVRTQSLQIALKFMVQITSTHTHKWPEPNKMIH